MTDRTDRLTALVAAKFTSPFGFLLDNDSPIPTKQDCDERFPNYMGWWTPIENGAFFTGLYLYGLVADEKAAAGRSALIHSLCDALFRLAGAAKEEGFIPRGLADDGESHYPYGSDDQFCPFVLGLYRLWRSGLADDAEKEKIAALAPRLIAVTKQNGWRYATDVPGVTRCACTGGVWREVIPRLFLARAAYEMTKDETWEADYRAALAEKPAGSPFSRLETASFGFAPYMVANPAHAHPWIYQTYHLMQYELMLTEDDPAAREAYRRGLIHNGVTALGFNRRFEGAVYGGAFGDWHGLRKTFDKAENDRDPNGFASRQGRDFDRLTPARRPEHMELSMSLFSAWICLICPDGSVRAEARRALDDCYERTPWEDLRMCYAFTAVCALIASTLPDALFQ